MSDPGKRIDVPIDCRRCFGIYTYSMLEKFGEKRKTSEHSDVCNSCLTSEELQALIINLECEELDIIESINQSNEQ